MAVGIGRRKLDYISDPEAWGALPWDLLSIAHYQLGDKNNARECAKKALQYSPTDERIKRNLTFMEG
jgi:Flp pilus assembly protein TadD